MVKNLPRPSTSLIDKDIDKVREMVLKNCYNLRELAHE